MNPSLEYIEIPLESIEPDLKLTIYPESGSLLFKIEEEEAAQYGESRFQILEGNSYEYKLSKSNYRLNCSINGIATTSNRDKSAGRIIPNIYVGTLTLYISKDGVDQTETKAYLEVLATKLNSEPDTSYRENYRFMLESITKKCTELLMQINSPVSQHFETDFEKENETTVYQRFAFAQSLINSEEFNGAVQRIISSPVTKWTEETELKDVRSLRRFNNSAIRQLASNSNRFPLPPDHYLTSQYNIKDIPARIFSNRKTETVDTPENRFIKHALEVFLKFCTDCESKFEKTKYYRQQKEAFALRVNLENHLNHSFFREVTRPDTLKLNSPVLQRKSGYREILNSWLVFDLAAKLIWTGGEKVYNAGKRDIAVLYEYWLFFALYDLFKNKFKLGNHSYEDKPYEHLIEPTNDGLNVMVKSGKHTALEGIFNTGSRKLNIKFSYNRSFSGGIAYSKKESGSWTKALRPDYTLTIWLDGTDEKEAEEKELIVHIHFDSKYKVTEFIVEKGIKSVPEDEDDLLEEEKTEERKGIYKNADLLKMHAYKDAIRRTGGAYILYPGTENQEPLRGFHEIIPGLGAFAIRPSEDNSGIEELSKFIDKVMNHFIDRASQREKIASKVYDVYGENKDDNLILDKSMPEYISGNKLIPDETFVLVGFYDNAQKLSWIEDNRLYNCRTGTVNGSLPLGYKHTNARYLLLHSHGEAKTASKFFKLKNDGLKLYSKSDLIKLNYPGVPQDLYLVYELEDEIEKEFENMKWDITKLNGYTRARGSGKPFSVSLTELMSAIV